MLISGFWYTKVLQAERVPVTRDLMTSMANLVCSQPPGFRLQHLQVFDAVHDTMIVELAYTDHEDL